MSIDRPATERHAEAEYLAQALRSGRKYRWMISTTSTEDDTPFPPDGKVRPFLRPYADARRYRPTRPRQPLRWLLHGARYLARKLMAPWLHHQARYNFATISVLEQIEQRVRALENAELELRHTLEILQRTCLPRADHKLGRKGKIQQAGLEKA